MNSMNVLGVGSSMRKASYGTKALKIVLSLINRYDAKTRLLDLREIAMPIYDPGLSNGADKKIQKVTDDVNWADAIILVSPDYHGSMSGSMKNFLDHYWEEFAGKAFGYICTSHEKGLTVMDQMRTAVRQCYGWSMPYGISINGEKDFRTNGNIRNEALSQRIQMLARDIVIYGKLHRNQFLNDLSSQEINTFASHYRH